VVRTATDPASLMQPIRTEVTALDRDVPVADLATLESWVTEAMAQTRFLLALTSAFAGLALVLAALGLYGVISFRRGSAPGKSECAWHLVPAIEMYAG
jgi:hypothetical protein